MNFRQGNRDEPEINLIPFIDILLVVLIFLMLTTTYSKFTELQVNLPVADAQPPKDNPQEIVVSVASDGRYAINREAVDGGSIDHLVQALRAAAKADDPVVVVSADAAATHQSVINVMDAARRAGLVQITFATQRPGGGH
ncbi:MAG: biopolymer transporter ExbD [Hydrogenophaga sp.]|jgi:biopolymer transport protein ExbD|uniref:ExbD/TolR family protein n=1 Tax=Hydrogenophaga sp. TaxID=1904254 RepID=UPI000EC07977|nr:biopolymer transporter ExbD [Hydrogenophaga sp.]MDD3784358.1 biopolymer transporter ExbD [Hydrogenophaga sp.]MDX9967463.1 biopolymer transporter ExbD [Hydrogenophaga sp.]HAJ13210.1 biopolymer transporter ExbD [Comamonadaceae bacterium]